jgi:phosphoribosylaminoimidazole-succinocarboxamide synthase
MIVTKTRPVPVECVVRGYLAGSAWKEYQRTSSVCGLEMPPDLPEAARLPEPIFTPATKAPVGEHDVNTSFAEMSTEVGSELAMSLRESSIALYKRAREVAEAKGIIIADTKFEFGVSSNGDTLLIDEVLTPDSSRFWPADRYRPGTTPESFDKQFVRDYLLSVNWNMSSPPPALPPEIVRKTQEKYREALTRLTR